MGARQCLLFLCVCVLGGVQLFVTLWTVALQAPLSMEFSRQEYWSGLPSPPAGDLPDPGIEPRSLVSPALAGGFFTTEPPGKLPGKPLLFPCEWVSISQACGQAGSDSLTSGPKSTDGTNSGAQFRPEAEGGGAIAEKAGTKLPGARQAVTPELDSLLSAWATGRSGSHRMWFSKGEEAYALNSNDFFLLTSIQSLCSLSLYAPMCTHMSTHICAHTDMRAHIVAQLVKNLPAMQETGVRSLGWEDPLEKEMATPSSILAWKISWTEEPGGLQSMGSQRVGYD